VGGNRASVSVNSYVFGRPLRGGLKLRVMANTVLRIAYDHPELSSTPRLALPVTFLFEDPPNALLYSSNYLSLGTTSYPSATASEPQDAPTSTGLTQLSPKIRTFLKSWPVDTQSVPLYSLHPQQSLPSSLSVRLFECIGNGRTCSAWRAGIKGIDSPLIFKIISGRYVTSVIRESLFYEAVFPLCGLAEFVPRYYGTYASCQGGWYAIVLEDAGVPVGRGDSFPQDDLELMREVGRFRQAFEEAGIRHGDIAARNVLRSPDGRLRLVDFGISTLMKKRRPLTG